MAVLLLLITQALAGSPSLSLSPFLDTPADTAALLAGLAALDQASRAEGADPDKAEAVTTATAHAVLDAAGGWPTAEQVGPDGGQHLWLFVQHTHDLALMEKAVRLLPEAVARGDVQASNLALLTDRYALFSGGQQQYGSQAAPVDGTWRPINLADPGGVDARRAAVGLGPLSEYLALLSGGEPWSLESAPIPEPIRAAVCENMGGPLCAAAPLP